MTKNEEFLLREIKQYNSKLPIFTNMRLYEDVSEQFIREYKDYLNWWNISVIFPIYNDFCREFVEYINWSVVIMERCDIDWKYKNAWAKEFDLQAKIINSCLEWYYIKK